MLRLLNRRLFITVAGAALALPAIALADPPVISAPEAQARLQDGSLIVLDIRSRAEWQETGIAQGAWPVSMHEQDFGPKLNAILAKYQPDQIAMICATGGRTDYVVRILEKNGVSGITDISEGMMGNTRGPGWIARGMPLSTLIEAQAAYDAAMRSN